MNKVFSIYAQNLSAYSESNIVGGWIDLPQKKEIIDQFLKEKVKINETNEEYEIASADNFPFDYNIIQYANLYDVNNLAMIYSCLDEQQIEATIGYCENIGKTMTVNEVINVCMLSGFIDYTQYNFEGVEHCKMFSNEEKYGYTLAESNGIHKLLLDNNIEYCFDFEKYGRDASISNNITLLDNGFLDMKDTLNLESFSKEEIIEQVNEQFIQEEYNIKTKPIVDKMDKLRNKFQELTENDISLKEHFKNDMRFTSIKVAEAILAGIAVRNLQREYGNLEGEFESSPFSNELEEMIDEYTRLEKQIEYVEQEIESKYEKEEIANDI